jgi:hypothetical protein
MAFITKSNAKSILFNISLQKAGNIPTDAIYIRDISILSDNERKWLAAARMFYENFDLFIEHVYLKKERPTDTKTLVYEGRSPSYHEDRSCKNLLSDYFNFEIPVEIQESGSEAVSQFRKWFRANEHSISENRQLFITKMEAAFLLKNPPSTKSLDAPNSGVETIENVDLQSLQSSIDGVLERATLILSKNDEKVCRY